MMQAYAEYKDSGVDWIGEIPAGWEVLKTKWICSEVEERSVEGEETLLSVSQYTGVTPRKGNPRSEYLTGYKSVFPDNLITNIMLAWMGALGVSKFAGIASPAYAVYQIQPTVCADFLEYLYKTNMYLAEFARKSTGVVPSRWRMYTDSFGQVQTILPPLHEQTAIADFLDDKTAKIEALIGIKRRQIALLEECKQILIQNAVTKGLNPDAPMKDSGVDWLGEIPAGWSVKRLKFLCSIGTGERNTEDKIDGGKYPFFVRSQKVEKINSYSFDGKAILTAGDGAGVGKVYHYVDGKFDFHQRVYKFSNFNGIFEKYLFHYISNTFYSVAILGTAKSTVDSLRLPLIQDFWISFPPQLPEQTAIADFIDDESEKINAAIKIKENQIAKLNEYKTTLINAAVTGKIKVT